MIGYTQFILQTIGTQWRNKELCTGFVDHKKVSSTNKFPTLSLQTRHSLNHSHLKQEM